MTRRKIVLERIGYKLIVHNPPPQLQEALHVALTYERLDFIRGKAAWEQFGQAQKAVLVPTRCYYDAIDPDGILRPKLVCAFGFRQRVCKVLRARGFQPVWRRTREPRAEAFVQNWDRLKQQEFRHKQRETLEVLGKSQGGLVVNPVGWGKTFLAKCYALLHPKARIHVTTYAQDVADMIYDGLCAELPSVGILSGRRKFRLDARVLVITAGSLHHGAKMRPRADVLWYDEVHEAATDDRLERIALYDLARRFGFTASLERPDKAQFELEGAFGPVLMEIPYAEAQAHGAVGEIRILWINMRMDYNPAAGISEPTEKMRMAIWQNDFRNAEIARAAQMFPDEQVLIMVDTLTHALELKYLLPEFEVVYSEQQEKGKVKSLTHYKLLQQLRELNMPSMTSERRRSLRKGFESGQTKKVIATTVWNRGVDFRNLAVLIRADAKDTPIGDTQIPGRTSRIHGDKPYALVVDFKDQFDEGFRRRATSRRRRYEAFGWKQIEPPADKHGKSQLELFHG